LASRFIFFLLYIIDNVYTDPFSALAGIQSYLICDL
jgi:hypothetical protein